MSTDAAATRPAAPTGEPATATSYEVRAALEELLERDLLGPRDGEREELLPECRRPSATWWGDSCRVPGPANRPRSPSPRTATIPISSTAR